MGTLRQAATFLAVLAVVANPAAAALKPCCCLERDPKPKHECCAKAAVERTEIPPASCCATKKTAPAPADCSEPSVDKQPCCCLKSLPATPAGREALQSHRHVVLQGSVLAAAVVLADFPPARDRIRRQQPGLLVPSLPPLPVLYCSWLK